MESNLYAPPVAVVADVPDVVEGKPFFVVGKAKFFLLFFLTAGFYQFVMYYIHWARFKRATKTPMWPIARAFFAIFFIHSLAEEVDHRLHRENIRYDWSPKLSATVVVVALIADRILGRIDESIVSAETSIIAMFALLLPTAWFLWQIQAAANLAAGDPDGQANRRLTLANWLWIVPFALLWLLVAAGLAMPDA
ncbi:hypothetical protein [Noviluteimonas gilva]|uniref:MFS transporter permease n=1 Tax=Noviluteimonas gilva TaxID=2682097 RepID=A0A7C9LJZ1_9GAMM|nr:hypothetical protein [Lysobacter gilvus]MUV13144.1 hypothetical protein [Lysobacter gilvus]